MRLSLQSFSTLVQNMAAAVQAAANQLVDLTIGSTLRAILEANASVALWLQWLILQVLQMTRAATSTGADLDSWMADMSLTRLGAAAATGLVTFSRLTPTVSASIPTGTLVRTADGSQTYAVVADTSNPAWNAATRSYNIASGITSIVLAVAAQQAGSAGNIQTGAITQLATALPGVDAVTNAGPLQNGRDAESDTALRSRFQNYIQSRSLATPLALNFAVASIQQGLGYALQENVDVTGQARPGSFVVTIDDGTGYPPSSLIATVARAIEAVRPVGSSFAVMPPMVTLANIDLAITVASGTLKPPVTAAVQTAIASYVSDLPIGGALSLTRVSQVAYAASGLVTNVGGVQINGIPGDLQVPVNGVVKSGTVTVN